MALMMCYNPLSAMNKTAFVKMHGLGNDFIVLDYLKNPAGAKKLKREFIQLICDRHFGVGADQVLVLVPPREFKKVGAKSPAAQLRQAAQLRMEVWNADGSTSEMCGNGIRAVALYMATSGPAKWRKSKHFAIETQGALNLVERKSKNIFRVNMGQPKIIGPAALELDPGENKVVFQVDVGNPHAILWVKDLHTFPCERIGPLVEMHPNFSNRTNVEFAQIRSSSHIELIVWERGAGFTLACGSGACATAAAAMDQHKVSSPVTVTLPGGDLTIEWEGHGEDLFMSGPATEVFRGVLRLP